MRSEVAANGSRNPFPGERNSVDVCIAKARLESHWSAEAENGMSSVGDVDVRG